MKCQSFDSGDLPCQAEATVVVFWPGKETRACDKHHRSMQRIADAMGFVLSSRPVEQQQGEQK